MSDCVQAELLEVGKSWVRFSNPQRRLLTLCVAYLFARQERLGISTGNAALEIHDRRAILRLSASPAVLMAKPHALEGQDIMSRPKREMPQWRGYQIHDHCKGSQILAEPVAEREKANHGSLQVHTKGQAPLSTSKDIDMAGSCCHSRGS